MYPYRTNAIWIRPGPKVYVRRKNVFSHDVLPEEDELNYDLLQIDGRWLFDLIEDDGEEYGTSYDAH